MDEKLNIVGEYNKNFNDILNINLSLQNIYAHNGLKVHIKNRRPNCLEYFDKITDIISNPTYIGVHPKKQNSVEFVKVYDKNIMVGIKLDIKNNYLYVATLFDIPTHKIEKRLLSGRLKNVKT